MAGVFKATAQDGLARCGVLAMRSGSVMTPTPMLYTRRGGALYLTPDMLEKLRPGAQLVQANALQFVHLPGPEVLRSMGRSAASYMGLQGWPVLLSNRDPLLAEYTTGTRTSTAAAAYVSVFTGGMMVSPACYMEIVAALQPDMYVALADEVPSDARPKRVVQSVDRTVQWLDDCMRLAQERQQQQRQLQHDADTTRSTDAPAMQLFAPIVGASLQEQRVRSAKAAAERDVAGFALCGFGAGERASVRPGLLEAALQHLPPHKPRLAAGLGSPEEVLDAVAAGVDLFDCCYPAQATAAGLALCFPVTPEQEAAAAAAAGSAAALHRDGDGACTAAHVEGQLRLDGRPLQEQGLDAAAAVGEVDAESGADGSKLNLWALRYRADTSPFVPGCSCWACSRHTRAYVHHLLHTHEMLAGVLLELHNTTWWLSFFDAIRGAIEQGRFQEYRDWFSGRRAAARARGQ